MNKVPKKIAACVLSGVLLCQPAVMDVSDNFVITAEAHSGRTDSSGGHKDNQNKSGLGSYHYHCGGNPAHLHEGRVCPYSAASTTVSDSGSAAGSAVETASEQNTTISASGKAIQLSSGDSVDLSKDLIKIVQDVLNQKGYDCGTADGIIGSKTIDAMIDFMDDQKENNSTDYLIINMIAEGLGIEFD